MRAGAVCGTLCGVGVVVCAVALALSDDVAISIMQMVGTFLFAAGSLGLAIGAWR